MQETMLKMVSYGIVAANKPLKSKNIEVTPVEKLTMMDGELTDNLSTQNAKVMDADGASLETTTKTAVTITATWLPMSSNRVTAPDVRRGEKVKIWQFGDADKYYWSELEYNPNLRKRETVKYSISNTAEETAVASEDNTYNFQWSTHEKLIHLHTSTSDGEPFGYDFLFNTKEGTVQITDTAGNTIFLDSEANRIVLANATGTSFDLNAEDLFVNVIRNMITKVGGDMMTEVQGDMTTIVKGNKGIAVSGEMKTGVVGKYTLNAEGGYLTETPKAEFVTPMLSTTEKFETGGTAKIGSDATVEGSLKLAKGMTTGVGGGGDITLNGTLNGTAGARFVGNVIAANIN